jgi:hypothetical protein
MITNANGDSIEMETLSLFSQNDSIIYRAKVNENGTYKTTDFKLTFLDKETKIAVFENPAHDFPTKITYRFKSETEIQAIVSGIIDSSERELRFDYMRK